MLQTTLAYKYVMTMAMVAFVNHYAPRLNLPIDVPIKDSDIHKLECAPPECSTNMTIFSGGFQIGKYSFGFQDGFIKSSYGLYTPYCVIVELEDDGLTSFGIPLLYPRESSVSVTERASRMKYTVKTNDLYRIATNYLVALEIDQKTFEKSRPFTILPNIYHSPQGLVPSPIMVACWGEPALRDPGSNGFAFKISSVTGELLEMNVGNASTCKGLPLIKDLDKLLAISDEEFLKMSPLEKSNPIVQFTAVHYLASVEPLHSATNVSSLPKIQNSK
jgi:hypothetical protein